MVQEAFCWQPGSFKNSKMKQIDLNCDLGEGIGNDALIMPFITSANIACGFHAGNPLIMEKTIQLCLVNNVNIGAHPGYPDLEGFGRKSIKMASDEIKSMMVYQIAALKGMTESLGGKLNHVKPHGALYNDAANSEDISKAIIQSILQVDTKIKLVALAGSITLDMAKESGLNTISEVFADRAYLPNQKLVPRSEANAVIHNAEECNQRVLKMITDGTVDAVNGEPIQIIAETVCLHGDNPSAVKMAQSLYQFLIKNGIEIK